MKNSKSKTGFSFAKVQNNYLLKSKLILGFIFLQTLQNCPLKERFPFDYFKTFVPTVLSSVIFPLIFNSYHCHFMADITRRIATGSDAMLSGFDSGNTDRTGFDWADGDGAFSVNNTTQATTKRRDDNNDSDEDDEPIDNMATNLMNFILLQEEEGEKDRQGGNIPTKKRRQPKKREQ